MDNCNFKKIIGCQMGPFCTVGYFLIISLPTLSTLCVVGKINFFHYLNVAT